MKIVNKFWQECKVEAAVDGRSPVVSPDPAILAGNVREEDGRKKGEQRRALCVNANWKQKWVGVCIYICDESREGRSRTIMVSFVLTLVIFFNHG